VNRAGNKIFRDLLMKIRIQANNIRFRLRQFEVEALGTTGMVKEVISFGNEEHEQLQFVLYRTNASSFSLEQNVSVIQLNIPENTAHEWTTTDLVGFEEKIRTVKGKEINILVEKDFKCLSRTDEDEAGSYPNPMKQC
jgi:hypothetical protein